MQAVGRLNKVGTIICTIMVKGGWVGGRMTVGRLNNAGTGFPASGLPLATYIYAATTFLPNPISLSYLHITFYLYQPEQRLAPGFSTTSASAAETSLHPSRSRIHLNMWIK